jgi:CcmD family protein
MKFKLFILLFFSFLANNLFAEPVENPFYANGKIYVVVTIMSIIFVGIVIYLIKIDRQLKKTEKELKNTKNDN